METYSISLTSRLFSDKRIHLLLIVPDLIINIREIKEGVIKYTPTLFLFFFQRQVKSEYFQLHGKVHIANFHMIRQVQGNGRKV